MLRAHGGGSIRAVVSKVVASVTSVVRKVKEREKSAPVEHNQSQII